MKIFISSTYSDLKNHRKKVMSYLEQFAGKIAAMELWGADPSRPLDYCLNEVDSSDIYVGIIGCRYGTVDEKTGKSYSQLEYERAVSMQKECLIFILDDKAYVPFGEVDLEYADNIIQFKKILRESHMVSFFTNEDDLVDKINISLSEFLKESGIDISNFNFTKFKNDAYKEWKKIRPSDLRIENFLYKKHDSLIKDLNKEIKKLEEFHNYITISYYNMENDLISLLTRLGVPTDKLNSIPYNENPFVNRDWELVTFFPNRINRMQLILLNIELKFYENESKESLWNEKLNKKIESTKRKIRKLMKKIYID